MKHINLHMKYYNLEPSNKLIALLTISLISVFLQSCSHKEIIGQFIKEPPKTESEYNFYDLNKIKVQLNLLSNLKAPENQQKLIELLIAYNKLNTHTRQNELKLTPLSKTDILFGSFCANSKKAIPEQNELFQWKKGPKNLILKDILDFYRKTPGLDKESIQEIIWNIENQTYYESYPDNLKAIIQKANPNAAIILPSKFKEDLIDNIIPNEIEKNINLVRGQYYSYSDLRKIFVQNKSNLILPKDRIYAEIPNTEIFTSTASQGFEYQTISFYNPTTNQQIINVSEYYLNPYRTDVQPIILASVVPVSNEIQNILEQSALKMLGYLGSQYPSLNAEEKKLVNDKPIEAAIGFYDALLAERKAEEFYPNSKKNGPSDAFRHYVWSGFLVRDIGEDSARKFLSAHESTRGQRMNEKNMDVYNNEQGIMSAKELLQKEYFNNSTFLYKAKKDLEAGKLRIISK